MNVYDLQHAIRSTDLKNYTLDQSGCVIRGLADSNLELHYLNNTAELVGIPEDDDDINSWIPVLDNNEIRTFTGYNITDKIFRLKNITTVILTRLSRLDDILYGQPTGIQKVISYLGKYTNRDIKITKRLNPDIIELNLPLNLNINELVINNPQLISVGINSAKFNYWNLLPSIDRYVVYTESRLDMRMSIHYIKGNVDYIMYQNYTI